MERSSVHIKKIILKLVIYSSMIFAFWIYIFLNNANANELVVCSSCKYKTISTAVSAISTGGTITIKKGLYKEGSPVIIDRTMTLRGDKGAVIDGEQKYQVITIKKADAVIIEGLRIQNSGSSYIEDLAGIKVIEGQNSEIINNSFLNTTYAVYLEKTKNCLIQNNKIEGKARDEVTSGNGVHIWNGTNNTVLGNSISGHRDGIYLEFSIGSNISDNLVQKNIRYGLHFMQSNDTLYEKNTFSENGAGVAVMYSTKIRMINNKFINNSGPASYGLLLKEISDSVILQNNFTDNTIGIYMEGSNRSLFKNNQIKDNAWGLKIMGNCEADNFTLNNFIGNTFEVVTNSSHSMNTFKNNYWSQYDGFDLDRDGIGDKPHRPISLSSIILEKVDSAYILLNSFFFRLIDEVERSLPEMINDELMDEAPLMKELELEK